MAWHPMSYDDSNGATKPDSGLVAGAQKVTTFTADTTLAYNAVALIDTSSNDVDLTLPTAAGITGRSYTIKAIDLTNIATVTPNGSETIDGVSGVYTFASLNDSITILSDGTNWLVI